MSWRYTLFKRTHFFLQDLIFGAGFGMLWSGILGWMLNAYIQPSPTLLYFSPWIGGAAGMIFGMGASAKFGRTSGSTQEHEKALSAYGDASTYILFVVATIIGMFAGYIYGGLIGLIAGGIIGLFIAASLGLMFAKLYFSTIGLVYGWIINIQTLLKGGMFDRAFTLVGLLLDYVFKTIEFVIVRLKISTRERLTGVTDAWEYYDKGIKFDRQNRTNEAIAEYKRAIELDPNIPEPYCNLAYDYGLLGNSVKEIEAYTQAVNIKPDYIKATHSLAICHVEQGNDVEAMELLKRLSNLRPETYSRDAYRMLIEIKLELAKSSN